ncbi:PorP/SprF family type IX secretion system membrane protein [Marinilabiliaceae bacterium ANBcel2]|nr:PorP/SprF family type IX secretion system membrane protein [Marinilabiliaceae bacterium ANBcel2]
MQFILTILFFLFFVSINGEAQKALNMSHYMHNQYAVNSAFGGSREVMTAYGAYRNQWGNLPGSPEALFFSMHAPLKNENVALGGSFFNEEFTIVKNRGLSLSYTYRVKTVNKRWLAFSLSGGFSSSTTNYKDVNLIDPSDPLFGNNESGISPGLSFGTAYYGDNFFLGISIRDLFYNTPFEEGSPFFEPSKTDYNFTGGYFYRFSESVGIQPSLLVNYNPDYQTTTDYSATLFLYDLLWVGATYRSNKELVGLLGFQLTRGLRFAYSYDLAMGELGNMNNGSHEFSLQFDFGFEIDVVNPKFF